MLEEMLEALVRRATEADDGVDLGRARESFHSRVGEFAPGDASYEARIQFFLDWYLCAWTSSDGTRPAERAARDPSERRLAEACARAERSLFLVTKVEEHGVRLQDPLGGGRFRAVHHKPLRALERLREGDLFDGHLLASGERIHVMPGRIFHPPEAHEPLFAIVERARAERPMERGELLDSLLRMQLRLERFTNMRAKHIYRWESLHERDILSAGWARRTN